MPGQPVSTADGIIFRDRNHQLHRSVRHPCIRK
jgi:hypothetical protein